MARDDRNRPLPPRHQSHPSQMVACVNDFSRWSIEFSVGSFLSLWVAVKTTSHVSGLSVACDTVAMASRESMGDSGHAQVTT